MFSALVSHFVLLLKGRHSLDGLPVRPGAFFVLLACAAVALDSIMNIVIEGVSPWFLLFEPLVPIAFVAMFGYRMASAWLIMIAFCDLVWIVLSLAVGELGFKAPFILYLAGIGYLALVNVVYWRKRGMIG